jgi:hypothetical protein
VSVPYLGPPDTVSDEPIVRPCDFDPDDLVIGGAAQHACFVALLKLAHSRVIVHSTFLDAKKFTALSEHIQEACKRGVTFDLLWGAEADDDTEKKNASAATEIARIVLDNPAMHGRVRMQLRTTGSHAKLILLDTSEGWCAAVGSCNWLSSPFQAVELSVVVRDNQIIADLCLALQRMVGRRGLADTIANEMALTARDLRRSAPSADHTAKMAVVVGDAHDRIIRGASGTAKRRFFVGSNRLGSTARPGALMQGELAASREVEATVLYTQSSGPLKNRHARALADEAASHGVQLRRHQKGPAPRQSGHVGR